MKAWWQDCPAGRQDCFACWQDWFACRQDWFAGRPDCLAWWQDCRNFAAFHPRQSIHPSPSTSCILDPWMTSYNSGLQKTFLSRRLAISSFAAVLMRHIHWKKWVRIAAMGASLSTFQYLGHRRHTFVRNERNIWE